MNIIERFKKNTPIHWKIIGTALVAASTAVIQYFAGDHTALRIVGAFMFIGYLITNLAVEEKSNV